MLLILIFKFLLTFYLKTKLSVVLFNAKSNEKTPLLLIVKNLSKLKRYILFAIWVNSNAAALKFLKRQIEITAKMKTQTHTTKRVKTESFLTSTFSLLKIAVFVLKGKYTFILSSTVSSFKQIMHWKGWIKWKKR